MNPNKTKVFSDFQTVELSGVPQSEYQLQWPDAEVSRIANRVQQDYRNSLADHNRRIQRWRGYYRRWRQIADIPPMGEEDASNFPVPYCQWNLFTKWSKEMDGLFGDDAEIVAVPVGPSDFRKDKKISRYMSWRVFNSMKLLSPFCVFVLRKLIFGRSVAYSPWKRETFTVKGKEVVDYEGADFQPLWPDDFIVPAEDVETLHDFSFVIRRVRVRPDDLLKGEEEGRYQNIRKNWERIVTYAQNGTMRDTSGEEIKREKDEAEGILYERPQSSGEWITVLEYYGRWRPLKSGKKDASEWDFDRREMRQAEFVFKYLWDLHIMIGIQSLEDLYPTMNKRRPFVESSMTKEGSYWSMGMCEMLVNIEDELCANHNQATEGAQMAMTPPLGYRPAAGVTPDTIRLAPGLAIPLDNPATDIREIKISANMDLAQWKEQTVLAYGEKLTGLSDLQMGRQIDRPNAPRTATQTVKLLEEGNVRISLDTKVLREDMSAVLTHIWQLEYLFSPEETFFRVTEEDADGLFPTQKGGSVLTMEDRDGRYDFRLEFASSVWSKEVKKETALARYQLDLANPLIVNNPRALWAVTRDAHEALGDPNFGDLVPEPPAPDLPVDPKEEATRMLQGEDVHVNPMDNDQLHMIRHAQDFARWQATPDHDVDAIAKLHAHYLQHVAQLTQKKIQQAVIEHAVKAANEATAAGQPLNFMHGLFGNAPFPPPGNPQAQNPVIYSGHPENLHGAS